MKVFSEAQLEVVKLECESVIVTSGNTPCSQQMACDFFSGCPNNY